MEICKKTPQLRGSNWRNFDVINFIILRLANLKAFDFATSSLKLMQSYQCNRFQRTKVNQSLSDWTEIVAGVPQSSNLGPLVYFFSSLIII